MAKITWHTLNIPAVLKLAAATKNGLTDEEVKARLHKYGPNVLPKDKQPSRFAIFARQMQSPLVYVLLAAVFITAFLREFIDMGVILAAVLINSAIGFWQEVKADQSFVLLKNMVKHEALVLRRQYSAATGKYNLRETVVDASQVVPGDVVILQAGDHIPADARLITVYDFETNEAALTGESMSVSKQLKALPSSATLAERSNMVFQGTAAARGKAVAVVVATGKATAFGEIALLVREVTEPITPLQERIELLAKWLGVFAVIITVLIFAVGVLQGRTILEMFLIAVAVAVAAIPEGLVVSLTIILALGMRKLARARAIVKRLLAAETLGSVSVICTDKTGTLTTGKMEVAEIWTADNLKGDGKYTGSRLLETSSRKTGLPAAIQKAFEIAVVGNETVISNPDARLEDWEVYGDPTPAALLRAGIGAGFDPRVLSKQYPKIDEIPFDTEHKWAATLHKSKGGGKDMLYVRGAPEHLLEASKSYLKGARIIKINAAQKRAFRGKLEDMAKRGDRVVAVTYGELARNGKTLKEMRSNHAPPGDLIFVGFFGLKDPLRKGTGEVIARAASAGIRTVMITGDHATTAGAIGSEVGLSGAVLTGADLDKMSDVEIRKQVKAVQIFARVLPKHKVRIVGAFHENGDTVAMTGDGVNDAPALKAADIGVAVGSGTDVAKAAADVVLTDNNLETIVGAVEGGRNLYENIKKVVAYLLSDSWTEIIIIVGSLIMGLPMPVLAAQILWVNLIEDSFPNIALAFDPGEPQIMKEPPRPRTAPIMDLPMKVIVFGVGITTSFLLFGLYIFLLDKTDHLEYIRTMIFVGLGVNSIFYIYSIRSLKRFIWNINPFNNAFLTIATMISVILLVGAVYIPALQTILQTVPLSRQDWIPLVGLGLANIVLIEIVKLIFIHKGRRYAAA